MKTEEGVVGSSWEIKYEENFVVLQVGDLVYFVKHDKITGNKFCRYWYDAVYRRLSLLSLCVLAAHRGWKKTRISGIAAVY